MANKNNEDFLGGGMQFNKVGSHPQTQPTNEDAGPIAVPSKMPARTVRSIIILAVVIVLAAVMFYISNSGLGETNTFSGHGGRHISSTDHTIDPDAKPE